LGGSRGWGKASNRQKSTLEAKPHGVLDLKTYLKLNLFLYIEKRAWPGLSKSFEKFEIASLEAELQLPELQLKSKNHMLLNRS
jgi:hypothetical protein